MTLLDIKRDFINKVNSKYNLDITHGEGYNSDRLAIHNGYFYSGITILKGYERGSMLIIEINSKYGDFDHFIRQGEIAEEPETAVTLKYSLSSENYNERRGDYDYEEAIDKIVDFIGLGVKK